MHLFHVPDLRCGGCLGFVLRALQHVDRHVRIEADLPARMIRVISARFESALLRTLRDAGFAADPVLQPWG
jgi:copper chaperone